MAADLSGGSIWLIKRGRRYEICSFKLTYQHYLFPPIPCMAVLLSAWIWIAWSMVLSIYGSRNSTGTEFLAFLHRKMDVHKSINKQMWKDLYHLLLLLCNERRKILPYLYHICNYIFLMYTYVGGRYIELDWRKPSKRCSFYCEENLNFDFRTAKRHDSLFCIVVDPFIFLS